MNSKQEKKPQTSEPVSAPPSSDPSQHLHLHYRSPAQDWSSALPVGNGRLGAMCYGRTTTELLQLNEDSVWYGGPQNRTPRDALRNLPELRRLIRGEQHAAAEELVRNAFFATPSSMRHYEPGGRVDLEFGHGDAVAGYRRWLDLERATCSTAYEWRPGASLGSRAANIRRDVLVSFPDQAILVRIVASEKSRFIIRLNRTSHVEYETNEYLDSIQSVEGRSDRLLLHATPGGANSNRLCIALGVTCDDLDHGATVEAVGNCLVVTSASCTIAIGAQTTYRVAYPEQAALSDVDAALSRPWDELLARHVADYQSLFNRASLRMYPDAHHITTDERIRNSRDPGLVALYHNYGRYLLIASSRDAEKALPATLQGIWNPNFAPAWGSKYTININLQMNYWPASASDLAECALPVVSLLETMAKRGEMTARTMYGCGGWCSHHNTDIWGDTDPQDRWMPATLWPLAGAWVCLDMVEMLRFRYDKALHERLAPILRGAVEFLLDFLIPSECGKYLVTNPSLSPENTFVTQAGAQGILCEGSVMDMAIVRWAFELLLWTDDGLGTAGPEFRLRVEEALTKIPPVQINGSGLIQEWGLKDYDEAEPGHRHVSHLFGLYPGHFMETPELQDAARRVLARRAANGGGHTGWSRAWLLNLHSRLRDHEGCGQHMDLLLSGSTLPNMLDNHPPFQIDGNFGGCAGILECLVQSKYADGAVVIELLPACPRQWSTGQLTGVCVREGWVVSFAWKDGEVQDPVTLVARDGGRALVVYPDGRRSNVSGHEVHTVYGGKEVA